MAVYLFGDIHGGYESYKLTAPYFPNQPLLTAQDTVIICGDFGFPFRSSDACPEAESSPDPQIRHYRAVYRQWMDWCSAQPYTIAFVDGNHDNHPYWAGQPTGFWNGGMVHRSPDAPNLIHLMRGEVYTIEGKNVWCFGGAESIDRTLRTEGLDWWPEEIASYDEMQHGLQTLSAHDNRVDVIITHTMPQCLLPVYGFGMGSLDPVAAYLDEVYRTTTFDRWFCGHLHKDLYKPFYKVQVLYQQYAVLE